MSPLTVPAKRLRDQRPTYRTADGRRVPSVTTILSVIAKPQLTEWANRLGLQGINSTTHVNELAGAGTLAHAAIEAALKGVPISDALVQEFSQEERDMGRRAWRNFVAWRRDHDLQPRLVEHQIVSETMRVGGTIDCYARIDGRLAVLDFKSSARVYDSHLVQLAAYRALLEEAGHQVDEVRVVLIPRDEGKAPSESVVIDTAKYHAVFEMAAELYRAQQQMHAAERRRKESEFAKREAKVIESQLQTMVEMSEPELAEIFARAKL